MEWLRRAGVEDFVLLDPDTLRTKRAICGCYFQPTDFTNPSKKSLKSYPVPLIIDPKIQPLSNELLKQFGEENETKLETVGTSNIYLFLGVLELEILLQMNK